MLVAISNGAPLDEAESWYQRRAEGAKGDVAQDAPISNAIRLFKEASLNPATEKQGTIGLIKSLFFKGCHVRNSKEVRKQIFDRGRHHGEAALLKYPNDPELKYWTALNWGLWVKEFGVFAAVKSRVLGKVKKLGDDLLQNDPEFGQGAVYLMVGRAHQQVPYVPFFAPWSSKEEAERFLKLGISKGPHHLAGYYFLAQLYFDQDRYAEALEIFKNVRSVEPRPEFYCEDLRIRWKLNKLRQKILSMGS
jgi:tetratricopeptide (TPR) repeat protein